MKKNKRTAAILPSGTFFYILLFEESGQCLTKKMLETHFPVPISKEDFKRNRLEFKGYEKGIVTALVFLNDGSQYMLYLHTGLDGIHVACSCGMPGEKLCYHAFMGLNMFIWRGSFDFGMYYWPDMETDERLKRKFLNIEISKERIFVEPGFRYGRMFRPGIAFGENLNFNEKMIGPNRDSKGGKMVVGYCLVYTFGLYHSSHLHTLMPVLGVTGKDGNTIISFRQFIMEEDDPITDIVFTDDQLLLNRICFAQYASSKRCEVLAIEERNDGLSEHKTEMLELWKEAIPLLMKQRYCYSFNTYASWLTKWDGKPKKSKMEKCSYSDVRPIVSFLLKFYGDHFILSVSVTVKGVPIKPDWLKPNLFIYDEGTELNYLMASVQDDDLLIRLSYERYRITVLKAHFREFHERFLVRLASAYEVLFSHSKSRKKTLYNFEMVVKECLKEK
nr:hypothetical protein [uncultured Pedobacter sp.]